MPKRASVPIRRFAVGIFILVACTVLVSVAHSQSRNPAFPAEIDEDAVLDEVRRTASAFGLSPVTAILSGDSIRANPNGSVHFGIGRIRALLEPLSATERGAALKFLVAHELWHLVQFKS